MSSSCVTAGRFFEVRSQNAEVRNICFITKSQNVADTLLLSRHKDFILR